ncbi:MAG TPA: hypothetical protein GXX36_11665 [Clostridiaceae bacterium]|nr:hypothetical protein [Clostridiaceae bacterium]
MKRVYAADFGAGNTCIYWLNPNGVHEANALNTPGGEPSGYAISKKGLYLGLGLYGLTFHQLEEIDSFHINIKARPDESHRAELVQYFKNWLRKMKLEHPEEFKDVDEPYWFIGCPTGDEWKEKKARELFKSIFEEAGFENVFIVPESNAALAYYQKTNRILDEYKQGTKFLLFDQGAYSLDVTYYDNGNVTSYGGYLGAGLIERMMAHIILYFDEEKIRLRKKMSINYPGTVQLARELVEKEGYDGKFYTYLLLQCRRLKERYFTAQAKNTLIKNADLMETLDYNDEDVPLTIFTNSVMMENILEKYSIKEILGLEFDRLAPEVQKSIGDNTWMQAFHNFLYQLDEKYPSIGDGKNTVIMVTGGGSLMNCIPEAIRAHYPAASVYCDQDAISAIGKGMAYWGPDKISALEFEKAFEAFTDREVIDEDGDSVNYINQSLAKAYFECVKNFVQDITGEEFKAVKYGLDQWREYKCSNTSISDKIEWHLRNWSKNTGIPSFISDIAKQIESLKSEINREFKKTASDFGLNEFELLKKEDEVFLSDCRRLLPEMFEAIVSEIVSYYKQLNWSVFPNDNKGLFSNKRLDFYNAIVDELNKWIGKSTDETVELCKKVFFELEFDVTDDYSCTFMQLFQLEGHIDLLNLMKVQVKKSWVNWFLRNIWKRTKECFIGL